MHGAGLGPAGPQPVGRAVGKVIHTNRVLAFVEFHLSRFQFLPVQTVVPDHLGVIDENSSPIVGSHFKGVFSGVWHLKFSFKDHSVVVIALGDANVQVA